MPATRILKSSGFPEALHASQMPALSLPPSIHKQKSCVCSPPSLCFSSNHWYSAFCWCWGGSTLQGEETLLKQCMGDSEMASATKNISLVHWISLQIDNISRHKEPLGRGSIGKSTSRPQCDSDPSSSSSAGTSLLTRVAVRPAASWAQSISNKMS